MDMMRLLKKKKTHETTENYLIHQKANWKFEVTIFITIIKNKQWFMYNGL